jgi:hypothetical protein
VFPGQVPVIRSNPVAPDRSTAARTPPKTAPWIAAAETTSVQPRCLSVASGVFSSSATRLQIRLKIAPAISPARAPATRPNGL